MGLVSGRVWYWIMVNAFIDIMASAAASSALGTEFLAVQHLFYNITPNSAASILYVQTSWHSINTASSTVLAAYFFSVNY